MTNADSATAVGSTIDQALRYLVVGMSGSVLYIGAYVALELVMTPTLANLIAWLISTVLCNAAHRRLTFGISGGRSAGLDAVFGLLTCVIGLLLSTVAVSLVSASSDLVQVSALLIGSGVGGAVRFLLLRWWFARGAVSPTPTAAVEIRSNQAVIPAVLSPI